MYRDMVDANIGPFLCRGVPAHSQVITGRWDTVHGEDVRILYRCDVTLGAHLSDSLQHPPRAPRAVHARRAEPLDVPLGEKERGEGGARGEYWAAPHRSARGAHDCRDAGRGWLAGCTDWSVHGCVLRRARACMHESESVPGVTWLSPAFLVKQVFRFETF